jgi:L-threonylcarbamoyladenylate synthase
MQSVIRKCGFPLAAPSANLSNRVSATNVTHVQRQLGGKIPLIVDGGQCQVGIESTVLDVSESPPRLLRPGMIHRETLAAAIGELGGGKHDGTGTLRSPGLLQKHYAPRARLVVRSWNSDSELRTRIEATGLPLLKTHIIAHTHIPSAEGLGGVSVIPHDAEAFARALYAQLHECDEAGAEVILVEAVPETDEWRALSDRLNRAATS